MAWETPIAAFSVVTGAGLGYLAYKRSVKVDATSAASGVATENRAGVQQVLDEYKDLIANQKARIDSQEVRITTLEEKLAELRRKYVNGNGTPPATPQTPKET